MPTLKCMKCKADGIWEHEAFMRLAVNMQKERLVNGHFDLFGFDGKVPAHVQRTKDELGGKIPVKNFPIEMVEKFIGQLEYNAKMAAQLLGIVTLCKGCADSIELDWAYNLPKVDLQTLHMIGVAVEEPLKDQARAELASEAESN